MAKCTYDQIKIAGVVIPLVADVYHWAEVGCPWLFEWDTVSAGFLCTLKTSVTEPDFNRIMDNISKALIEQYWDNNEGVVR